MTYEGVVRPTNGEPKEEQRNPLAPHKHLIRRAFHRQLKHLWTTDPFLKKCQVFPQDYKINETVGDLAGQWAPDENKMVPLVAAVAALYHEYGYRFVPLVREQWSVMCALDILVLRRDYPGAGVIHAGDIDNRIKTIIDTLRRPANQTELVGDDRVPRDGEDPFFVLMEDDKQVSHLTVEADRLLIEPVGDAAAQNWAKVIVTVEIRPFYVTQFNLSLS